jgi:hypothetical protein
MYRPLGVLTAIAITLSGCLTAGQDEDAFAEEPVPVVDADPDPQLAALPPVPARRPSDMSAFLPPEEAHLAEKKIDDLVGLSLEETESLLGGPSFEQVQPPARIWSYNSRDCVLSIFFYPRVGGADYRALAYEVKGPNTEPKEVEAAAQPAEGAADQEASEEDIRCFTTLIAQYASSRRMAADKQQEAPASEPAQ